MAFGFPAYHQETVSCRGMEPSAIHDAVVKRLIEFKWGIRFESATEILASSSLSLSSWGEKIEIRISGDSLFVKSSCAMPTQCLDWGKNKKNVFKFLSAFTQQNSAIEP